MIKAKLKDKQEIADWVLSLKEWDFWVDGLTFAFETSLPSGMKKLKNFANVVASATGQCPTILFGGGNQPKRKHLSCHFHIWISFPGETPSLKLMEGLVEHWTHGRVGEVHQLHEMSDEHKLNAAIYPTKHEHFDLLVGHQNTRQCRKGKCKH